MCASPAPAVDHLQVRFLGLLPRIEWQVRCYFRDVRCPARRDDCAAEAVALAWRWFVELAQRGKDAATFPTVLASFAARAVRSGRRVTGQERAHDVMSRVAQRRHDFLVTSLPASNRAPFEHLYATARGQERLDTLEECLRDNTQSAVPDQVCFRLDFPAWRSTRTERDRRVIDDLMTGSRTQEVARRFGLTPSRVSQLRRDFRNDWQWFCGDGDETDQMPVETERGSACPG